MSAHENISQNNGATVRPCATLADTDGKRGAENDPRALWLVILQALAMVTSAIRKHVGAKGSCEGCGRVL
jgi:hypothetical protein